MSKQKTEEPCRTYAILSTLGKDYSSTKEPVRRLFGYRREYDKNKKQNSFRIFQIDHATLKVNYFLRTSDDEPPFEDLTEREWNGVLYKIHDTESFHQLTTKDLKPGNRSLRQTIAKTLANRRNSYDYWYEQWSAYIARILAHEGFITADLNDPRVPTTCWKRISEIEPFADFEN